MKIIDSFLIDAKQAPLLQHHLFRSQESFKHFFPSVNTSELELVYQSALTHCPSDKKIKVRIEFNTENLQLSVIEYQPIGEIEAPIQLIKAPRCLSIPEIQIAKFKTDQRQHWKEWDQITSQQNTIDILAYNSNGFITETSRYSIFCIQNSVAITPPLSDGCLNGVLRKNILEMGYIHWNQQKMTVIEKSISLQEIHQFEIIVGNSVRGLMQARLLD